MPANARSYFFTTGTKSVDPPTEVLPCEVRGVVLGLLQWCAKWSPLPPHGGSVRPLSISSSFFSFFFALRLFFCWIRGLPDTPPRVTIAPPAPAPAPPACRFIRRSMRAARPLVRAAAASRAVRPRACISAAASSSQSQATTLATVRARDPTRASAHGASNSMRAVPVRAAPCAPSQAGRPLRRTRRCAGAGVPLARRPLLPCLTVRPDASPRGRPPLSMRLVVGGGGGGASGLDGSQGADILQPQPQHAQHTLRRCVSAPHPCAARRWRPPSALRDSDAPFLFQPGFDMDYTLAQVRSGLLAGTAPRKGETPARRHSHSRRPSRGVWGTCSLPTAVPTQLAQPLAPRHC